MKSELMIKAERLEQRISGSTGDQRLELQPEFSGVIARLCESGEQVPLRLKRLEATLSDEAVEARFDNMPV